MLRKTQKEKKKRKKIMTRVKRKKCSGKKKDTAKSEIVPSYVVV